jgi:hypothetical protein
MRALSSNNNLKMQMTNMKQNLKNLVILAGVAGLSLAVSGTLHAQTVEKVAVSATKYEQGNTTQNRAGTIITTAAPSKGTLSTASLVAALAQDDGTPADGKLGFNGTAFVIIEGTNATPVTDLSLTPNSSLAELTSGITTTNGSGTPPFSEDVYQNATLTYGPGSTSGLNFSVSGLAITTVKAGAPAKSGHKEGDYSESASLSFQDGTGGGTSGTNAFLLTGFTITGSGSGTGSTNSD